LEHFGTFWTQEQQIKTANFSEKIKISAKIFANIKDIL
jgi:hypothetical protein